MVNYSHDVAPIFRESELIPALCLVKQMSPVPLLRLGQLRRLSSAHYYRIVQYRHNYEQLPRLPASGAVYNMFPCGFELFTEHTFNLRTPPQVTI
jgi:hypothetical protein